MAKVRLQILEGLDIGLKNRDFVAFITLYISSIIVLALVGFYWKEIFGWRYLWALVLLEFFLSIFFGFLFARYALSPLLQRNEELDRLLQETLHELNIPIATIKANLQMLKRSSDDGGKKRLDRIDKATEQLQRLYEEVDYLIKCQIDRVKKEPVRVDEVIKDRVAGLSELLSNRVVDLHVEPLEVELEKRGFIKVIDNILANAIKYSEDRTTIKVVLAKGVLSIEDEGKGISKEELVRIFDRYYQADGKAPGYGIGLAIVKEYCDEAGIEVRIDSEVGKGTKVILDLTKI